MFNKQQMIEELESFIKERKVCLNQTPGTWTPNITKELAKQYRIEIAVARVSLIILKGIDL